MAQVKLRDRDSILTDEGIIFRVFGYSHPQGFFVCDAEYASAKIFTSIDPRAPRTGGRQTFYKFYNDEGWKLIFKKFPQYTMFHEMLGTTVVGIQKDKIAQVRKPQERLQVLMGRASEDELQSAMKHVLETALQSSGLSQESFGLFGSLLHGFHHPKFSDIDFVVYGRKPVGHIRAALNTLYTAPSSNFRNEFETDTPIKGKLWRFRNYNQREFLWHQRRKLIYGIFDDPQSGRSIKTEFEPVKEWTQIVQQPNPGSQILQKGWVRLTALVTEDKDAPFIPSVYGIEPVEVLKGTNKALETNTLISYMEEFRLQAQKDEKVIVEGNLEELVTPEGSSHQVVLTYCPRYYDQVLKVII